MSIAYGELDHEEALRGYRIEGAGGPTPFPAEWRAIHRDPEHTEQPAQGFDNPAWMERPVKIDAATAAGREKAIVHRRVHIDRVQDAYTLLYGDDPGITVRTNGERHSTPYAFNPRASIPNALTYIDVGFDDDQHMRELHSTIHISKKEYLFTKNQKGHKATLEVAIACSLAMSFNLTKTDMATLDWSQVNWENEDLDPSPYGNHYPVGGKADLLMRSVPPYIAFWCRRLARSIIADQNDASVSEAQAVGWTLGRVVAVDREDDGDAMATAYLQPVGFRSSCNAHENTPKHIEMSEAAHEISGGTLLAFRFDASDLDFYPEAGTMMWVQAERWVGVGRVLDAVRVAGREPMFYGYDAGIAQSFKDTSIMWDELMQSQSTHTPLTPQWSIDGHDDTPSYPSTMMKGRREWFGDASDVRAYIAAHATHERMVEAKIVDVPAEADPEVFIPAWKDKRGVKVVDQAFGRYPKYHDEVRCPVCNGRVLLKFPEGNQISSVKCPHCGHEPDSINTEHLIDHDELAQTPTTGE